MPKKGGLGHGLGSLLGEPSSAPASLGDLGVATTSSPDLPVEGVGRMLRIVDVMPNPDQPRKAFDPELLEQLADSIRRVGVLQPITVRPRADGRYLIVAGERRWRAARMAELSEIPAVVVDADDRFAAELALIENLQRENLNPIEEAEGYKSLMDEFGFTQEEVADAVGRGRATIANSVRLLDLADGVIDMVRSGSLSAGHAKALGALKPEVQVKLAEDAVRAKQSVREVEQASRRAKQKEKPLPPKEARKSDAAQVERYLTQLGDTLSKRYERKVRITGAGRRGKVEFEYYNMDDLNRILEVFLGMTGGDEQ